MRNTFEEQLRLLNQELLEMGALIEHAIQSASEALIRQDVEASNRSASSFFCSSSPWRGTFA